jgi:hypothetical protein
MEGTNTNTVNLSAEALKVACSQVGQKEVPVGSNKGPMVTKYLKSVGITSPAAWCMAFVYWCYLEAARAAGLHCPVVRTAGVLDCWNKTASNLKLHKVEAMSRPELISAGDQIVFQHGNGTGHTGIVESFDRLTMTIHTIEGNTNGDGGREGYEVMRKLRKLDDVHLVGFIRYGMGVEKPV